MTTLALDIGATKIAFALMSPDHAVLERHQIPSNVTTEIWADLAPLLKQFSPTRIGVASAGPIDIQSGTISPVNIPQWRSFPIVAFLNEIFGHTPIALLGDCTAVALAENKLGAGIGSRNMLGVVVSTGIGGGLVLGSKAFHGETGNAALFGHHSISFSYGNLPAVKCDCGRTGCLETFARGPKMVEYAKSRGWNEGNDFIALANSARNNDSVALEAIDVGTHALAVGITNVLNITDIHKVVIGGGVSFAGEVFWQPFLKHFEIEKSYAGFLNHVEVLPAKLREDAGLVGASLFAAESDKIDSDNV